MWLSRDAGQAPCGNGYRCPKRDGKPNLAIARKCLWHRHFLDSIGNRGQRAFTARSSRYLNRPSKLSVHIRLNKPANGSALIRQSVGRFGDQIMRPSKDGARSDAKPVPTFADRAQGKRSQLGQGPHSGETAANDNKGETKHVSGHIGSG
jgi:hypothetical protein